MHSSVRLVARRFGAAAMVVTALSLAGCSNDLVYEVRLYVDFGDDEPPADHAIRIDVCDHGGVQCAEQLAALGVRNGISSSAVGSYQVGANERTVHLVVRDGAETGSRFRVRAWTYAPGDVGCARWCSTGSTDDGTLVAGERGFELGDEIDADVAAVEHFGHQVSMRRDCGAWACLE